MKKLYDGMVVHWDQQKKFGFLSNESLRFGSQIFFHLADCGDYARSGELIKSRPYGLGYEPRVGDQIVFHLGHGERGVKAVTWLFKFLYDFRKEVEERLLFEKTRTSNRPQTKSKPSEDSHWKTNPFEGKTWRQIFCCVGNVTRNDVQRKYRELASKYHPDKEGVSNVIMAEINKARDIAFREI